MNKLLQAELWEIQIILYLILSTQVHLEWVKIPAEETHTSPIKGECPIHGIYNAYDPKCYRCPQPQSEDIETKE